MALKNTPACCPPLLKVNLLLAAGIGSLQGSAASYGAFRAAVAKTSDETLMALDPRDCTNKVYPGSTAGTYGVTLEYSKSDCAVLTDDCSADWCGEGEEATRSSEVQNFDITECAGFDVKIGDEQWGDVCCDVEPYMRKVAEALSTGQADKAAMATIVRDSMQFLGTYDRAYTIAGISEKIANKLNHPTAGVLQRINTYILNRINAGAGYNYVKDTVTGDPVGLLPWELKVLYNQVSQGCATGIFQIDAAALRLELIKFKRTNPDCTGKICIIGGDKFMGLEDQLGILDGVDDKGVNKGSELRSALSQIDEYYYDSQIDDLFGDGTFFIVEEKSLAFFWLTFWNNPNYRTDSYAMVDGKKVTHVKGEKEATTMTFMVGNCRDGQYPLTFDTFFTVKKGATCTDNATFNFKFKARYALWTRKAVGCADLNPRTGIYKCKLVALC